MVAHRGGNMLPSLFLFLIFGAAEGAQVSASSPHKYRVEPNGQLAVTGTHWSEGQNASDRGAMVRRERGVEAVEDHGMGGQSLAQEGSKGLLQCGWTAFAPDDPCPVECPLLAEESWNPCHFQCVAEDQCGVLDPKATIADYEQKRCRRCIVAGCDICSSGGKDKCHKCSIGYILDDKGQCYSGGWYIWAFAKTFGVVALTIVALWVVDMALRRPTNLKGLKHGMKFRKRTRNHMPRDTPNKLGVIDPEDDGGMLYPMATNTLVTPVGGAGTSLHFSFQAYMIVLAFVLTMSWAYWAKMYGYDLVKLGTLPAHTPQQLCAVVRWGAKRQEEMFEDKFYFILWAYMFMFVSCIGFAAYQQIRFKQMDNAVTMKDYACYVRGLPSKSGEEDVEGMWKDFLEKETGQRLVGVSVAWDLMKRSDFEEVEEALELEGKALEKAHTLLKNGGQPPAEEEDEIVLPPGGLTKAFKPLDNLFLKMVLGLGKGTEEEEAEVDVDRVRELLEKMKTSDVCFAVFETEEARDAAVELAKSKRGFMWEKNVVRLEVKACEPGTILWHGQSLGSRTGQRTRKMIWGWIFVILCLALWSCLFYLPYAYYVTAFTYANGDEPSAVANLVFTLLVVGGNATMYFIADAITTWCDFGFEDERQYYYNVYYLIACILNVIADMFVTAYLAYKEMIGIGVHTADGKLLESLVYVQDIIEAYPMQKTLGSMLYAYCYPGTFLFPFMAEPIGLILIPYLISKWLLRSHREYQDRDAELCMAFFIPMDLGRYSDVLLNMICGILILFLPGGYVLPMFLSMALSHVYIYCFDHWRVLRALPQFCYSRNLNDQFGTSWMALPCALTLSAAVFKGYHIYWPDLNGTSLTCVMLWAFLFHLFLHSFILKKIYKMKGVHKKAEQTYAETAKWTADTWFSTNPVHCLRSKYIWGHEPAQVFWMQGKEHLQRENKEIGAYFEDKEAQQPEASKKKEAIKAPAAAPKAKPVYKAW